MPLSPLKLRLRFSSGDAALSKTIFFLPSSLYYCCSWLPFDCETMKLFLQQLNLRVWQRMLRDRMMRDDGGKWKRDWKVERGSTDSELGSSSRDAPVSTLLTCLLWKYQSLRKLVEKLEGDLPKSFKSWEKRTRDAESKMERRRPFLRL